MKSLDGRQRSARGGHRRHRRDNEIRNRSKMDDLHRLWDVVYLRCHAEEEK